MKKTFHVLVITTLVCFSSFICGMENSMQKLQLPIEIIETIAFSGSVLVNHGEKKDWFIHLASKLGLHHASKLGYIDIVKILIEAKADVNKKNSRDETPLCMAIGPVTHCIAKGNGHIDIVKLLIEAGADVNQANMGSTPLHLASEYDYVDIVMLLLATGADTTLKNKYGKTAYQIAQRNGHEDIAKLLHNHDLCIQELITKGACAAYDLAIKLGYDPNLLYRNIASMQAKGKSLDKSLNRLSYDKSVLQLLAQNHPSLEKQDLKFSDQNEDFCWQRNRKFDVKWLKNAIACKITYSDAFGMAIAIQDFYLSKITSIKRAYKSKIIPINVTSEYGYTDMMNSLSTARSDMMDALIKAKSDTVNSLIEAKIDLNIEDKDYNTPLHAASEHGYFDIVEILIAAKADVNKENIISGNTPLHTATLHNKKDTVKLLINAGADVNKEDIDHRTPLHYAAAKDHTDIVNLLINAKADINKEDKDRRTPLYYAILHNNKDTVKLLLCARADVNKENKDHETSLHIAAKHGWIDIVKLLINAGADVNKENKDQETPLHIAAKGDDTDDGFRLAYVDIVKLLINAGADVNKGNKDRETPLHSAAKAKYHGVVYDCAANIVTLLLKAGADTTLKNKNGESVLQLAQHKNRHDITKLLNNHPSINLNPYYKPKENNAEITLHVAAKSNNRKMANSLLNAGADVNEAKNNGYTPLHSAVDEGHIEMVMVLLAFGADVTLKTKDGETVFQLAQRKNHKDIVDLLSNHQQCLQKLIKEGAYAAYQLAMERAYNSNLTYYTDVLYESVLSMRNKGKSLGKSLDKLSLEELHYELSPLKGGIKPRIKDKLFTLNDY